MNGFVDANIFIRLLTGDDIEKSRRSRELWQKAARGDLELTTSEGVIVEVVYVLSSPVTYRTPRSGIAAKVGAALINPGLRLDHKETVLKALDHYGNSNLDFVDCLCVAHAERRSLPGIYSYDRDLNRGPGVRRLEP